MSIGKAIGVLHSIQKLTDALGVTDWAVFVTHEQGSKVPNLIMKLGDLLVEGLILCRVHFYLGLKVG